MSLAFRKILVPTDFSETAGTALYYAVQLARQFDGELHVLHVCEDPMLLAGWPHLRIRSRSRNWRGGGCTPRAVEGRCSSPRTRAG